MITAIKIMLILLIGIAMGSFLTFQAYQPLKLAQEIEKLKTDVDMCESRWVRDFSKKHGLIEEKDEKTALRPSR